MRRYGGFLACLTAVAAASSGCTAPPPALAVALVDTLPGGNIRVVNPGPTGWADTSGWRLVLDHVIQPDEGDPFEIVQGGAAVGGLNRIAVDSRGNIYIADAPPVTILVFSPAGASLRKVGREGDGPGEYRHHGVVVVRDTLVALTGQQGRAVTLFAVDGKPIARWNAPSSQFIAPAHADPMGGLWLVDIAPGARSVRRLNLRGEVTAELPLVIDAEGRFNPSAVIVTLHGTVVLGVTSNSTWVEFTPAGDTVRVVSGPDGSVTLTDSAVAARREVAARRARSLPPGMAGALPDVALETSSWGTMRTDNAGRWWISRYSPTGAADRWDVFTPEGILLGTVPMPEAFRTGEVRDMAWHDGRLHVLLRRWGATERPAVLIFRVEKSHQDR